MQIVIDIDEKMYEDCKTRNTLHYSLYNFSSMIANGTPLPKGHGKIIDVTDLLDRIGLDDTEENREDNVGEIVMLEDIDFIPAIIEADGGGEDDEEREGQTDRISHTGE